MADEFDYSAFTSQFVDECREHVEKMDADLLQLEDAPDNAEILAEIVREAHTVKGAAKMMGADDIATLAHKMEDLLGEVKEGRMALSHDIADRLFVALDGLDNLLLAFGGQEAKPADAAALTDELDAFMSGAEPAKKTAESVKAVAEPTKETEPEKPKGKIKTEAEPAATAASSEPEVEPTVKPAAAKKDETIRVSSKKLDNLSNLTGEMVIHHIRQSERENTVKQLVDQYKTQEGRIKALIEAARSAKVGENLIRDIEVIDAGRNLMSTGLRDLYRTWREDDNQMGMLIEQLTDEVLGARMVPVSKLFDTFSRPVRDLARQFKKEVELVIEGGDTELDRHMIEIIQDPMIHMIRNALDHGIEDPDARVAAGKPRQGRLLLAARHEGEYVVIEMSDDGAGINSEKVKEKALKRQLITESEAGRMGDAEMTQLLFKPGFSTSDIITDVSGRGVGMDVVKTKVEELKGMVYLRSAAGKGTTVTLKVPLTLAMSRVMFVRAAGQLLAIPTTSMQEAVLIQRDAIKTIEGREAYVLRGHAVPLVGLDSVLGLDEVAAVERDRMPVVIIDLAGTRVGFVVDEMVGEHEVVIKALGPHLAKVGNIAGATILGSGEVVLILNPPDLIGSAALHYGHHSSIKAARSKSERKQTELRILVVDDSSTIRELEKGILLTAGYSVDEAVDGVDALAKVKKFKYDLMLVDIQMPRMDGLAFTKRIKGDSDFADIPIIIMTTLEKDEDKRRGIEAGADAYMVKKAFDQANLLSVIEQLTAA